MNILAVEDNPQNLYLLEVLLKGNGYDVVPAANGAEALKKLGTGGFDLIISDLLMPVMDGFQLCRTVKADKNLRHIPFIVYTATDTSPEDEAFALKLGADRFIVKPCEPDVLMAAIQTVMTAIRQREMALTPEPLKGKDMFRQHNERLVKKLEQKISQLEKEIQTQQEVEKHLRTSERTLKTLFENTVDGMIVADIKTGRFTLANDAICRMIGCSAEEIKRLSVTDIHPEESLDHVRLQFEKQARGEISLAPDIPVKRQDGSIFFADVNAAPLELKGRLHVLGIFRDITERKIAEKKLQNSLDTIKKLKDRLKAENIYLREKVVSKHSYGEFIGTSDPMKYAMYRIRQVAPKHVTVLLTGETGTGKSIFARIIHRESDRRDKPFVSVNCANLPANLIESELFGREKGAFTGSSAKQIGRFELAHGGTLFLDEIGEMTSELQAKLLRVVEHGEFELLGSPQPVKVDVRIIASTNRNFEEEIKKGRFRQDLFYRLNVFPVTLPPLRQRKEDIPLLVEFFVGKFTRRFGKHIEKLPKSSMDHLEAYAWPGNAGVDQCH